MHFFVETTNERSPHRKKFCLQEISATLNPSLILVKTRTTEQNVREKSSYHKNYRHDQVTLSQVFC